METLLNLATAEGDVSLARNGALFVVRQLSEGGVTNVEQAIQAVRGADFPRDISAHPVVDEMARAVQKVSPLAALPLFADTVIAMCNLAQVAAGQDSRDALAVLVRMPPETCLAALAAYLLNVPPTPLPDFDTFFARYKMDIVAQPMQALMGRFEAEAPALRALPEATRLLLIHLVVLSMQQERHVKFTMDFVLETRNNEAAVAAFRRQVEEILNPKCPRCQRVFVDWTG